MTVEELIDAAEELTVSERVRLLDELTRRLALASNLGPATALRGVGAAIRDEIDAQEYVNRERDSWGE